MDSLGIHNAAANNIISQIDIRTDRILLPEFVTRMSGLEDGDEVIIDAENGIVKLKKDME